MITYSNIITRKTACEILSEHVGRDLSRLAKAHGVTIIGKSGNINKGWRGLACERIAGVAPNNRKAPNGLGWEVKAVSYYCKDGIWFPKETMAITMIDYDDLDNDDFFHSHLWSKMKSLIFCPVSWEGKHSIHSRLLKVTAFDFLKTDHLINECRKDYEFIRNKLKTYGTKSLTSRDGQYIQARTKGAGHGSTTRAFYAKKSFLEDICPPFYEEQAVEVFGERVAI